MDTQCVLFEGINWIFKYYLNELQALIGFLELLQRLSDLCFEWDFLRWEQLTWTAEVCSEINPALWTSL
jgi:hypothetical protein